VPILPHITPHLAIAKLRGPSLTGTGSYLQSMLKLPFINKINYLL